MFFEFICHARDTKTQNVELFQTSGTCSEDRKKLKGGRLLCVLTGRGQLIGPVYTGQLLGAPDPCVQPCKHCTSYLEGISPAVRPQH